MCLRQTIRLTTSDCLCSRSQSSLVVVGSDVACNTEDVGGSNEVFSFAFRGRGVINLAQVSSQSCGQTRSELILYFHQVMSSPGIGGTGRGSLCACTSGCGTQEKLDNG
jgi:hypothetical protein